MTKDANGSVNEMGSSQYSGDGANGDIKVVKDAKAMIAEKNVPKTIKTLNSIFYIFILILLGISGVHIYFVVSNKEMLDDAAVGIKMTNYRHSLLSEINFYTRYLWLVGLYALSHLVIK